MVVSVAKRETSQEKQRMGFHPQAGSMHGCMPPTCIRHFHRLFTRTNRRGSGSPAYPCSCYQNGCHECKQGKWCFGQARAIRSSFLQILRVSDCVAPILRLRIAQSSCADAIFRVGFSAVWVSLPIASVSSIVLKTFVVTGCSNRSRHKQQHTSSRIRFKYCVENIRRDRLFESLTTETTAYFQQDPFQQIFP
jgi:hypothetical protein